MKEAKEPERQLDPSFYEESPLNKESTPEEQVHSLENIFLDRWKFDKNNLPDFYGQQTEKIKYEDVLKKISIPKSNYRINKDLEELFHETIFEEKDK